MVAGKGGVARVPSGLSQRYLQHDRNVIMMWPIMKDCWNSVTNSAMNCAVGRNREVFPLVTYSARVLS
jgi:hypothetical protein